MKEQPVILASRTASIPANCIVGESMKGRCSQCSTEVCLSPSSQKMIQEQNAIVVCMECGIPYLVASGGQVHVTREQIDNMRRTNPAALYNLLSRIARQRARNN